MILKEINFFFFFSQKRITHRRKRFQLRPIRNKAGTCICISPEYLHRCRTGTIEDSRIRRYPCNFHPNRPTCIPRGTRNGTCRIYSRNGRTRTNYWTSRTRLCRRTSARYSHRGAWSPSRTRIETIQDNWGSGHFRKEYCRWRIRLYPCKCSHPLWSQRRNRTANKCVTTGLSSPQIIPFWMYVRFNTNNFAYKVILTLKDPSVLMHWALESHPPLFVRHSLMSRHSTPFPTKPSWQVHSYEPWVFWHSANSLHE